MICFELLILIPNKIAVNHWLTKSQSARAVLSAFRSTSNFPENCAHPHSIPHSDSKPEGIGSQFKTKFRVQFGSLRTADSSITMVRLRRDF